MFYCYSYRLFYQFSVKQISLDNEKLIA